MQKNQKGLQKTISAAKKATENLRGVIVDTSVLKRNGAKPYRTLFGYQGKQIHLGYFENPEDAAHAYNKKAKSVFGSEKKAKELGRWNVIS